MIARCGEDTANLSECPRMAGLIYLGFKLFVDLVSTRRATSFIVVAHPLVEYPVFLCRVGSSRTSSRPTDGAHLARRPERGSCGMLVRICTVSVPNGLVDESIRDRAGRTVSPAMIRDQVVSLLLKRNDFPAIVPYELDVARPAGDALREPKLFARKELARNARTLCQVGVHNLARHGALRAAVVADCEGSRPKTRRDTSSHVRGEESLALMLRLRPRGGSRSPE